MRILGWILTIMGYFWAFSAAVLLSTTVMNGLSGAGLIILICLGKLVLAALAIWGGSKLRDKAEAQALDAQKNSQPSPVTRHSEAE